MSDRRQALEAAFQAAEAPEEQVEQVTAPVVTETAPTEQAETTSVETIETAPVVSETETTETASTETAPTETAPVTDKPPQAWKPAERAKWATLDPTVRAEVTRREREITQTLNDTAQARKFAAEFGQVVQPYMARLQSLNAHPLQAVQGLLRSDYLLSTAPKEQRAKLIAQLITHYGVDIPALDDALSGRAQPDPIQTQVEQAVQQRIAPLLQAEQQRRQLENAQADQQVQAALGIFADKTKFPYFEQVRQDMADIVELSAKKGVHITLEAAYNKAVQLDPTVTADLAAKASSVKAAAANLAAQRAKRASSSIGGAPVVVDLGSPANASRRDTILAALDSIGGR